MSYPELIDNKVDVTTVKNFATIIGATPSKGARSPLLWNAAFNECKISAKMVPFDVFDERLFPLLEELNGVDTYIGGAVTMPHKEKVAQWLGEDRLTAEARRIGAVNCLFRNKDGSLWGTNTDGEGALRCAIKHEMVRPGSRVLLLGAGGAGKAVAAYMAGYGAKVRLCVRQPEKVRKFATRIGAQVVAWDELDRELADTDLLINATPLGFKGAALSEESPVSAEALRKLPAEAGVYDLIYDPSPTRLLADAQKRGLKTLDGKGMNLEQAVLGFQYAVSGPDQDVVSAAMKSV